MDIYIIYILCPLFPKDSLPGTVLWIDSRSFSIVNISFHCLLTCKVSIEKYHSLMEIPTYATGCFSLTAYKTLFVYIYT